MAADWDGSKAKAHEAVQWLLAEWRKHWRLLVAAGLGIALVSVAIDVSDQQGRFDLPSGYAVRMTCEADPESALWSGGCERIAADIARKDKPSLFELYGAFVDAHHRHIPSPVTRRRFENIPCEPGFDIEKALSGTRYVFIPLRQHFATACTAAEVQAVEAELDERDRALLTIEREGLSHAALYAGAAANLTEPVVIFAVAFVAAALLIL